MRRRLIVMRHAKSAWDTDAPSDHARPLNGRGRRDAPKMGRTLASLAWVPDTVWSSDSERTRETWERMEEELGAECDPVFTRELYHAGLGALQTAATDWPSGAETVLVLGHNPGWESTVSNLTGIPVTMTTGNAALLVGEGATWAEAMSNGWRLDRLIRPREL